MAKKETTKPSTEKAAGKKPTKPVEKTFVEKILEGLPSKHEELTVDQLKTLTTRYNQFKDQMSDEEKAHICGMGNEALKRLRAEGKVPAKKVEKPDAKPDAKPVEKKADAKPVEKVTVKKVIKLSADDIMLLVGEMNDVMSLTPPIDGYAEDCLKRVDAELAGIRPEDFVQKPGDEEHQVFSKKAVELIKLLGITIPGEAAPAKTGEKGVVTRNRSKVVWELDESKLPPPLPKDGKVNNTILAFRAFLKAKGKITPEDMVKAVGAAGGALKESTAGAHLYCFVRHWYPKFR